MSKLKCNNCDEVFTDDDELEIMQDNEGHFKGCPTCRTDGFLMDINEEELTWAT